METTITTEKNYTINYEEAWAYWVKLRVEFTFNGVNYEAKCNLIAGDDIDDIEVLNLDTNEYMEFTKHEAWALGESLLFNMNVNKYLEC